MVHVTKDLMDITPEHRMENLQKSNEEKKSNLASKKKELEELEKKNKEEIKQLEEKKQKDLAEIEEKRKELEELEKKKLEDIEYTDKLIEKSFQELMDNKWKILEEQDQNLESITKNIPQTGGTIPNMTYGKPIDASLNDTNPSFYDSANRQVYTSLVGIRNRAANGEMTAEDEQFVENIMQNFQRLESSGDMNMQNINDNTYVVREKTLLEQINTYFHR